MLASTLPRLLLLATCLCSAFGSGSTRAAERRVLLIAGPPSHPPGQHEHNAGVLLLRNGLAGVPQLQVEVSLNGFPSSPAAFDGLDAVLIYADGGPSHIALRDENFTVLQNAMRRGVGLALLHYAVMPAIEKGRQEFLAWIGGVYEVGWSVNPHWDAAFMGLPEHPVTRGVHPFAIHDEWYFHLRFAPEMTGVTPLLSAVPPHSTMARPDGDHSGNPHVRAAVARGEPQIVAWAFERPNGGRGFGFTGGHFHRNWANDDFRRLVLNAILWLAGAEVPRNGVESAVTEADLLHSLDQKPPKKS